MSTCDRCRKVLANRHSLSRHKKTCPVRFSEEGTSLHSSGDSTYSHPAGSSQYSKKWSENAINGDILSKNEESEPLVKVIKLSADGVPSAFSSHSTSYDDQDDDEDRPLTESEFKELWRRFKTLHHELIHERKRENITELNKILQIRLEEKMLNHIDYMKAINTINKDYLATYL